jgi:hypothetical protein
MECARCSDKGSFTGPLIHHLRIVQRSEIQSARETLGFGEKNYAPASFWCGDKCDTGMFLPDR